MEPKGIIYCALFVISLSTTCVQSTRQHFIKGAQSAETTSTVLTDETNTKHFTKRDASIVLLNGGPQEERSTRPQTDIYKMRTRHNYIAPRPERAKYGRKVKRPQRTFERNNRLHFFYSKHIDKRGKKYHQKSRPKPLRWALYQSNKRNKKNVSPSIKHGDYVDDVRNFAEPPKNYHQHQTFRESLVDSYGEPLKKPSVVQYENSDSINDFNIAESASALDVKEFDDDTIIADTPTLMQQHNINNDNFKYNLPAHYKVKHETRTNGSDYAIDDSEVDIVNLNKYSKYSNKYLSNEISKKTKRRSKYSEKVINKPWVSLKAESKEEERILVGGQYAEPPAREIQLVQQEPASNILYFVDDSLYEVPFTGSISSPVSAYVNYKNSNLAFSPQNLNDAFSLDR